MKFKEGILVFGMIFLLGIVSADIISINSGGDSQLIVNPGSGIEDFFFEFNLRPLMSNVILSSTFGTNLTSENLTVTYSSSDPNGDSITNITDWRIGGNSISVLNMPFDTRRTQGEIRDYSTYQNNGTLGGGVSSRVPVWKSDCQVGGCYEFEGVDDYVSVPSISFGAGDNWTISSWINQTGTKSYEFWIGDITTGAEGINLDDALGRVQFRDISANYHTWNTGLSYKNNWHYFTWVARGNSGGNGVIELFIDGTSYGNVSSPTEFTINGIGRGYSTESWNFEGKIDETKIYSRALSPEQIKANYQSGLNGKSPETLVSQETEKGDTWQ